MQSPRRSPRISAESSKRQSPRVLAKQANHSTTILSSKGKGRASTGGREIIDKENDPDVSPTTKKGKIVRRAYSVGGKLLRKSSAAAVKDNTLSIVPSRRNVPGPRKSAIRALPPQIFLSPTNTEPAPQISRSASASTDAISALGGTELMELMNAVGPVQEKQRRSTEEQSKQEARKSYSATGQGAALVAVTERIEEQYDDDNTIARKKRRVTFNPYQERADFYLEEPTMRIKPTGESELVLANSSGSSNESVDMSLDSTDDSASMSAEEASMEMTAAYDGSISIREASFQQSLVEDDSAMDMTTAYGRSLPSGEADDGDDSESGQSSDVEESTRQDRGDATVTMQFTSLYMAEEGDSQLEETVDEEEEEEKDEEDDDGEDEEVDMQLTSLSEGVVDESSSLQEEDDSAMELTEVFNQSYDVTTTKTSRESLAPTQRRSNSRLLSPDRSIASPRIGHEYCKIPAADSPKHNLSAASLKAQARRQSLSHSPIKPATPSSKSLLGGSKTSPSATPFRLSTQHHHAKESLPIPSSPKRNPPSPSRHSSPAAHPATPSRVWKSFRKSQGGTDASPAAKRLSIEPQSPSRNSFGSPQRIAVRSKSVPEEVEEEEARDAVVKSDGLTMKQFFDSLDLGFLELSMPSKRRVYRDSQVEGETDTAEVIKAACAHLPFLDSLVGACEELESTVADGHAMALEYESTFLQSPPLYVSEVTSMTSVSEKQRAISAFRIQKSAARANALQAYYAWRMDRQFSESALQRWEEVRSKLEGDVQFVKKTSQLITDQALPVLKRRHRELLEQVDRERKRQRALEKCDDDEMNELHCAMEEQSSVLAGQKALHMEAKDELDRIQSQIKHIAAKKKAIEEAVDVARASYESISICTKEEATRLARQVNHLETLHLWTLCRAGLSEIVLELEDALSLTMQLGSVAVSNVQINVFRGGIWQETLQRATEDRLRSMQGEAQPADLIRFVTTAWSRMRHFTSIFDMLLARFPAEIETYRDEKDNQEGVIVRAAVLLARQKSKVIVEAKCGMMRLLDCKSSLFELEDISAYCVYGNVDAPAIAAQVADCVTMGTSAGDLTKAISEAMETFG